jgi:diketogulonate reductase-like aldo/keto reductase
MAMKMMTRQIPISGEALPVIGLGTWQTFDVAAGAPERAALGQVLAAFLDAGGRVIDSSPMYGRAEATVGDLLATLGPRAEGERRPTSPPFLATKVWTTGKARGEEQMTTSMRRMGRQAPRAIDLLQIHNLQDWRTHLATLRDWKAAGRVRYIGVTHYDLGAFDELERIIKTERVDFVQLPYSIGVRKAEERLLPAAADHRTAVLVMRPFEAGSLFREVRGRPLPAFAAEIGCTTWAQLFLKFILGHPAVTCPIPATANPRHLAENVAAGSGRLPDEGMRRKLIAAVGA